MNELIHIEQPQCDTASVEQMQYDAFKITQPQMGEAFIPYCQVLDDVPQEPLKFVPHFPATNTMRPPSRGIPWNPRKSKRR